MDVFERIELRRFVGRELLLWLWFESEVFEATLSTKLHGSFGMWLEGRLVLSAGQEVTTIKGTMPGQHREAKEALLRGKMPDSAGLHVAWAGHDVTFTLKAEKLAIAGLKLPKAGPADEGENAAETAAVMAGGKKPRGGRAKSARPGAGADSGDGADEALYERMRLTRELEGIVESLYRDFLVLRLGAAWSETVTPALEAWSTGEALDAEAYGSARAKALGGARSQKRR